MQGRPRPRAQGKEMSSLIEALSDHLAGRKGLDLLVVDVQNSRKELVEHQKDISGMLAGIPDFLVGTEQAAWLGVFTKLDDKLKKVAENIQDAALITDLNEELPQLTEQLATHSLALRDAAWAARGPSSHPGANELLYLLDRYSEDPSDERVQFLYAKLEVEAARFEHQAQYYQELPDFIAEAMEELLPEYRDILETLSHIPDLEEEQMEELFQTIEDWGNNFMVYDLGFLQKRYSQVPTQIPALNFALNCQLLFLDELVNGDMVDYAIEQAGEIIQSGSEKFLEEHSLSTLARHTYDETLTRLLEELENLVEVQEKEELKEAGEELIRLTQTFINAQSDAEDQSGSRLDFKSEAQ